MLTIAKEFSFDMAHLLDGHDGKCHNLHGHRYRLVVTLSGPLITDGAKAGMLIDFADLKAIVCNNIVNQLDHAFIYDTTNQNERKIANLLISMQRKTYAIDKRSTAENLAMHIYSVLKPHLPNLTKIQLFETPNSYVEYAQQ